jgi:thiamine-phosphate pyrophosphorylase
MVSKSAPKLIKVNTNLMQPDSSLKRSCPMKLPRRGLYGITDDGLLPENTLLAGVKMALDNGLSLLRYRAKLILSPQAALSLKQLLVLCEAYCVPLLINDNPQLCLEVGAHGAHLGQSDGSVAKTRRMLGHDAIIGVTCHSSLDKALAAQQESADYVAFGRFLPSQTKPSAAPADVSILATAC